MLFQPSCFEKLFITVFCPRHPPPPSLCSPQEMSQEGKFFPEIPILGADSTVVLATEYVSLALHWLDWKLKILTEALHIFVSNQVFLCWC